MSTESEKSGGTASFSAIVALAFPRNVGNGKSKYLELDAELYVGSQSCTTLYGALRLFNSQNLIFSDETPGLYTVQATVSCYASPPLLILSICTVCEG
jgi:hypothetical protein